MAKILLTSIGSLGDINPIIALGKYLKENGHEITIATCESYRQNSVSAGLDFVTVRPDYDPKDEVLCRAIVHPTLTLYNVHKLILSREQIENSISDFSKLVTNYDFVIGNVFSYPAKIACLKYDVKWVSLNLCSLCFFSSYDPPVLYPLLFLKRVRFCSSLIHRILYRLMFKIVDYWGREVHRAYKRHGLKNCGSLMLKAPFSKDLNIALFPKQFGSPQLDWPINTVQTDFINYSGENNTLDSELFAFIKSGDRPILVTLGSVSIYNMHVYLDPIIDLIRKTPDRYILTIPEKYKEIYSVLKDDRIYLTGFIPYKTAMSYMRAVIHQGGIGTVANCYSAKTYQIIIPSCTDQFDNAFRVRDLGQGDFVPLTRLSSSKLLQKYNKISDRSNQESLPEHDHQDSLLKYF